MNPKKLLSLVVSIFIIISLFIVYSKYRNEKLAIEKEKLKIEQENNEIHEIQRQIRDYVKENNGELIQEELSDKTSLYKIKIEDIYKVEINSKLFTQKKESNDDFETVKFFNENGEVKFQYEVNYYFLPKMVILIDDVGVTTSTIKYFDEINRPINFAILPYLARSRETNEILKSKGYTTMLHMPMEGSSEALNKNTKGIVFTWMKDSTVLKNIDEALADIGPVKGFNNHMGSTFTSSESKMKPVINYAKENNLFYVDSNTSRKNKGYGLAKELGVPTTLCRHFLDNSKNVDDIKKEIRRAVAITKSNDKALFIGHYHKNMAIALKESIDFIEASGVKLVYVNEILE